MKKKGTSLPINTMIIVILAIAVAAVMIVNFVLPTGQKSERLSDAPTSLFPCRCEIVGYDRVCSASTPVGGYSEIAKPSECAQWEDCNEKCWEN